VVFAAFLMVSSASFGAAGVDKSWWESADDSYRQALATVLGGDVASWSMLDNYAKPSAGTMTNVLGRQVLLPGVHGLVLTKNTRYPVGTEILATYHFRPGNGENASFLLAAGIKNPTNAQDKVLSFACSGQGGSGYLHCGAGDWIMDSNKVPHTVSYYYLNGVGQRSLSWPDRLRRIVEHEAVSLRSLGETFFTVRITLLDKAYRVFVNDRLLLERQDQKLDPSGMVRLQFTGKGGLVSFSVRPAAAAALPYEPVGLDGYVNARKLDKAALDRAALPTPGKIVTVNSIPFTFPAVDDRGNDHIDVGPSWLQCGYLEGHMDPHTGEFGGRWPGSFMQNPARIRLEIPNRRYRAVHIVAAADGAPDSVPVVTLQFYRKSAGAPVNIATRVPLFTVTSTQTVALPARFENGKPCSLHLVTVPIDPGLLAPFDDQSTLSVELTKEVRLFRGYPDPAQYSYHGAGLPSSVHIYAMTFEAPRISMSVTPEAYANVWTAPKQPSYTIALTNFTPVAQTVTVEVSTVSYDGSEKTIQKKPVSVPASRNASLVVPVPLKKYGYHDITLKLTDGDQAWSEVLSLAWLHEDTRERGNWEPGKGTCYGSWCWGGGHGTPPAVKEIEILALAGGECEGGSFETAAADVKAVAQKYGMVTFKQFSAGDHYTTADLAGSLTKTNEQAAVAMFLENLRKTETKPSPITQPRYISFYPEPHLGAITCGAFPDYYGEPVHKMEKPEEDRFQYFLKGLLVGAPVVKQNWPNVKILLPHGDPMFTALFLRKSVEARKWVDGLAVDIPVFERLPEQQIHQVSLHRLWMATEEFRRAGKTNMALPMYEGPCLPTRPGALTQKECADQMVRCALILNGYGIDQFPGAWSVFECSGYWGEQHYGGGLMHRIPNERPKPVYCAHATMTRLLNRRNFKKWLPTGSLSVYAVQYQHYKTTNDYSYVFWTIRGRRPVSLTVPAGTKATVFDMMDNGVEVKETNGVISFVAESEPRIVQGLTADPLITLGTPDHSDAQPAATARLLSNIGNGKWTLSEEADKTYTDNNYLQIARFPGKMSIRQEPAPQPQGGKALAVKLEKQEKERKIMPFFTTLVPPKPVEIPGKASHLGLWVQAASDWGRVVYSLRDAQDERWISIGTKEEWNCDDIHNWSMFCFDGWRYLRFELPANSPYDTYREHGSTWWGHFGKGDGIVDLPLKLEKIIVERRTHAMYVNDPQPAKPDDVLLGDLFAEYERTEDAGAEAVKLSRLRMPVPEGIPALGNPIPDMTAQGVGTAIAVKNITLPEQAADGTQCYVHFDPVAGAKAYDIWVSPYEHGEGALQLAKGWTKSGQLLRGLRPDTDFYLFLVYTDKDGKPSKPSTPYKVRLKDIFGMK